MIPCLLTLEQSKKYKAARALRLFPGKWPVRIFAAVVVAAASTHPAAQLRAQSEVITAGKETPSVPDRQLHDAVLARIATCGMSNCSKISLKVANGSVELSGTVTDPEQKELVLQQVARVPGVLKVHSSLIVVSAAVPGSPTTGVTCTPWSDKSTLPPLPRSNGQGEKPSQCDFTLPGASPERMLPLPTTASAALPPCTPDPFAPGLCATPCSPAGGSLIDQLRPGFTAGASLYLLQPYMPNNVAFATTTGLGTPGPATTATDFNWSFKPAFDIWAGINLGDGFGIRARWFHLDGSSETMFASNGPGTTTTGIAPSPNLPTLPGGATFGSPGLLLNSGVGKDLLSFTSSLRIDAVDGEATYDWQTDRWAFQVGGGGRYLTMSQSYNAKLINNPHDGVTLETQNLNYIHNFSGGGTTIDFLALMRVGQTNLSLYASGRESLLVGKSTEQINYVQVVDDPRGLTNGGAFPFHSMNNPSSSNSTYNLLSVTEIELGLEYGRNWGRTHCFVRAGVVNQVYFGAGSASRMDGDLGLFGGRFVVGLNY